jgi:hypothetical protein
MRQRGKTICRLCSAPTGCIAALPWKIKNVFGGEVESQICRSVEKGQSMCVNWLACTNTNKHDRAREDQENKHLDQELSIVDEQNLETNEEMVKNRTALKYIERRMDMLGETATDSDRHIFMEEQRAIDRLSIKHQRQIRNLHRQQNKERHETLKAQQKELDDLQLEYVMKVRQKTKDLERNSWKLEELIHVRSMRLVARWHLMLQIYKTEDRDGMGFKWALPLSLLGLPEEFAPFVAAYQIWSRHLYRVQFLTPSPLWVTRLAGRMIPIE